MPNGWTNFTESETPLSSRNRLTLNDGIVFCGERIHVRYRNVSRCFVFAASMRENVWIFYCVPQRCSGRKFLNSKFESLGKGWKKPVFSAYGVNCVLNQS